MSADQWEDFALEWAHSLKEKYRDVQKCGGAGDMGRDVIAFAAEGESDTWDNFQCKHYDHPLHPGDVWLELGKLCYYTKIGEYTVPRKYTFVSPMGCGNALSKLLRDPQGLKGGLIEKWDEKCKSKITATSEVSLDAEMMDHLDSVDFSIFSALSPLTLIEEHSTTPWHAVRFGGGLPARSPSAPPPDSPVESERVYIRALLDAYEERLASELSAIDELSDTDLIRHLKRSRVEFYCAESLREFSRDNVPPGTFEALLDEVENGIADAIESAHPDAFELVLAVVRHAKTMPLTSNALIHRVSAPDKGGMCHQLANQEKVRWRR